MGRKEKLEIQRLAAGGLGLGRLEGRVVFIPGVLPGEEVLVEVLESRSDFFRARPLEVLRAHPHRRDPPCPLFMVCGGCQLMHADEGLQLELKVEAALGKLCAAASIRPEIRPSPLALFYRDRVRLHTGLVDNRLRLGLYAAGGRQLIPLTFCHQLNARINEALPELAAWLETLSGETDSLGGLEIQAGLPGEPLLVSLELNGRPSERARGIIQAGPGFDCHTAFSVKGQKKQGRLAGRVTCLELDEPDVILTAAHHVFTQVNPGVNRLLVGDLPAWAAQWGSGRMLDLYSGLGNFAVPLALIAKSVTAVEAGPLAVACARRNLEINQVKNVRLRRADSGTAVRDLAAQGARFDLVVMDPPRSGARGLAPDIARLGAQRIVYISCHPAALSRDMNEFRSLGYRLESLTVYDMFPQTAHMEAAAVLVGP